MGDLFEDYAAGPAWDEMFDPNGGLRPGYAALHGALAALGVDDLAERGALRDRSLRDQGITFSLSGEERPIPLDLLPRVIAAEEWVVLEAGGIQRVRGAVRKWRVPLVLRPDLRAAGCHGRRLQRHGHRHHQLLDARPPEHSTARTALLRPRGRGASCVASRGRLPGGGT